MLIKNLPVSIIIPVLNEEKTILHTMTAIFMMTAHPSEIILIDAGSTDSTKEIISKWFEKEKPSFKHIILHEQGALPGRGRNLGIEKASYDWIAFLDSGVIPEKDWLETSYEFATKNNKNASWGTCHFEGKNCFEKIICASGQGQKRKLTYFLASSLFHKTIFHQIGYFPEDLRACEDRIWAKRFRDHFGNDYICYNAKVNYYYFPKTLWAAIRKWYIYSFHTSLSRISKLHTLCYICLFTAFLISPFVSKAAFIILLTVYLFLRGIISPIIKSKPSNWFQNNIISFFVAPFIILLIDLAKFTGFIAGIIKDTFGSPPCVYKRKPRIARISSDPLVFTHLKDLLKYHVGKNADITLISRNGECLNSLQNELKLPHLIVDIKEKICPIKDFIAMVKLYTIFRQYRFDIIHSSTPKVGFLCSIAGFFTRIPVRIQTIHNENFGGIDLERFDLNKYPGQNEIIRKELGVSPDSKIVIFVGRITKNNGVEELVESIRRLRTLKYNVELLLLGSCEPDIDQIDINIYNFIKTCPYIHFLGFKKNPEYHLAGSDIFSLPGYHKNFGTVVLEAAAMGIPSVGTKIPGLMDAISDQKTGILIQKKDINALMDALKKLLDNDQYRIQLGQQAKTRAEKDFKHTVIAEHLWADYKKQFENDPTFANSIFQ